MGKARHLQYKPLQSQKKRRLRKNNGEAMKEQCQEQWEQ
jgi:hypothetical protein